MRRLGSSRGLTWHWSNMLRSEEPQELIVRDSTAWREWLAINHGESAGAWLVIAKKGTSTPTELTYDQAVEEALAHGWIDGLARRRDEATFRLRFTPRRKRSPWSRRNVAIAERLISEGRMHEAGFAEVERARADGRWHGPTPMGPTGDGD